MGLRTERAGTTVRVWIDAFIPTWESRQFPFTFECGSGNEAYAGLLKQHITDTVGDAVEAARRAAYEQGWNDAKAKRARCDWFKRQL